MRDWDDFENIFKLLEDMMSSNYSGGYMKRNSHNYSDISIDMQEDDDYIYITMELKVQEEDLDISINEDFISLEIMLEGVWRKRNIKLPTRVDPKSAKTSFNNYILDIKLKKLRENNNVDEKI